MSEHKLDKIIDGLSSLISVISDSIPLLTGLYNYFREIKEIDLKKKK